MKTEAKSDPKKGVVGYRGHRRGSRKEALHEYFDDHRPARQGFIKKCEAKKLSASTGANWYQVFRGMPRYKRPSKKK